MEASTRDKRGIDSIISVEIELPRACLLSSIITAARLHRCNMVGVSDRECTETNPLLPTVRSGSVPSHGTAELWGYGYMALAALFWSILSFGIHISTTVFQVPVLACILVRGIVTMILTGILIGILRPPRLVPEKSAVLPLFLRALAGTIGCYCIFSAVKFLPIGEATTIFSTSPAITMLLSALVLHEPVTLVDAGAVVSTFIGVALVSQPTFLFHRNQTDIVGSVETKFEHTDIGLAFALGAACCASSVYTLTRAMGTRIHFILNVIVISISFSLFALIFSPAEDFINLFNNRMGLLVVIVASAASFGCVASFSRGLQLCRAGPAMVIRTLDIPITYVCGFIFLSETVSPLKLMGVVLIFGSSAAIGLREILSPISNENETPANP